MPTDLHQPPTDPHQPKSDSKTFMLEGSLGEGDSEFSGGFFRGSVIANVDIERDDDPLFDLTFFNRDNQVALKFNSSDEISDNGVFQRRRHARCPGRILCWNFEVWQRY